jgi:hypothetical protein
VRTPRAPHSKHGGRRSAGTLPVTDGLVGAYYGENYDATAGTWVDAGPQGNDVNNTAGKFSLLNETRGGKTFTTVLGTTTTKMLFPFQFNSTGWYTFFHVCR